MTITNQVERAARRFSSYLAELRQVFLERDDVLTQVALALLGREHVLLMGPPGTAKSQLARAVLGRIVDATTGEPSLFARQFTENTVLTDLVGPIDFKTLMETGRSEHFTDEGVIGSVHAFLDEVFDGRDMLLRSTLNLLGEREFKQGRSTVRGRIECSLMTSNRYLTEVLEESRESLLAFVDRIAFVGFVPKGFSSDEPMRQVLRRSLAGNFTLHQYLTIQDLDVLQDLVERVRVPPEASDRLVTFLANFEQEMAATVRAVPDFSPSRYLSIRTRVRAAKLLKSIVVYRKLVEDPAHPLEALPSDFEYLRFALLQSGPPPALLANFAAEQDAREARQLKIIKLEREVFERCLARLDREPFRGAAPAVRLDPHAWSSASLDELLELSERASDDRSADPDLVAQLAQLVLARLIEQGLASGGAAGADLERHAELLERVERWRGPVDPLVRYLRGRGVALLESAIEREILHLEALSEAGAARGASETIRLLEVVLGRLQGWLEQGEAARRSLPELSLERLRQLLATAVAVMTSRLREGFLIEARAIQAKPNEPWDADSPLALKLRRALEAAHAFEAQVAPLQGSLTGLLDGVVAPAVLPIARQALAPLADVSRAGLLFAFDAIWAKLAEAQLARHLPLDEVLATTLSHAVTQERKVWAELPTPGGAGYSLVEHEALRRAVPRASLCFVALQLCLRLDPQCVGSFALRPNLEVFAARLSKLPAELRAELQAHDLKRLTVWLDFLDAWLAQALAPAAAAPELYALLSVLEAEGATTRIRLETELIEAVLPVTAAECEQLRERVATLIARATTAASARVQAH